MGAARTGLAEAAPDAPDAVLRGFVGYGLRRAMAVVQADLARMLEPFGLRMLTFSVLAVIEGTPGLRPARLAEALAIERPNLATLLDELAARGWIRRDRDPNDRRAQVLYATPAGQAVLAEARIAVEVHDRRMVACLNAAERSNLLAALARIEAIGGTGS